LTTALLFQTDLSRSAVFARTRSTPPTSSKSGALIRHRFNPGFSPGHRKSLSQTPSFWRGLSSST